MREWKGVFIVLDLLTCILNNIVHVSQNMNSQDSSKGTLCGSIMPENTLWEALH